MYVHLYYTRTHIIYIWYIHTINNIYIYYKYNLHLDKVGLLHQLAQDVFGVVLAPRAHGLHVKANFDL